MTSETTVGGATRLGEAAGPDSVSARMDDAAEDDPRCGWPKKDGSPCRNRVPSEGKVCRVHQKAALLDRLLAGGSEADGSDRPSADADSESAHRA